MRFLLGVRQPIVPGRRAAALAVAGCLGLAACSVDAPVAVEESVASSGELAPDEQAGIPPTGGSDDIDTLPVIEAPLTDLDWGPCDPFGAPDASSLGTSGWECARLAAPMDPFEDVVEVGEVQLALTRHPATGDRRGSILLNPGGPGGAGLQTAWGVRGGMPADMLRSFDIVGWDPRGVGQSTPGIQCDEELSPGAVDFIAVCVERTGPLSAFLSAPYSAADMEAIRVALGEERLNYLGFSYGSILGATYAAAYSDRVGAFVLDGVTDPESGSPDGPFSGTFAVFADDGFPEARERFIELCDASDACLGGVSAERVLDGLGRQAPGLPTDNFDGEPQRVDVEAYQGFLEASFTYAGDWELVATALSDADLGDASAMAALISGNSDDPSAGDDDDSSDRDTTTFAEANFMIYCADFAPVLEDATFCDDMALNRQPLREVQPVDVDRDILLIGTEYDPLTPGYHAPEFRDALGDATHMIWEGVGHTAFPGWTPCIDSAVADQFLGRPVPDDGTRCSFLAGAETDAEIADELFGSGDLESLRSLEFALGLRRIGADEACVADAMNQLDAQIISHTILNVTSLDALDALDEASARC